MRCSSQWVYSWLNWQLINTYVIIDHASYWVIHHSPYSTTPRTTALARLLWDKVAEAENSLDTRYCFAGMKVKHYVLLMRLVKQAIS